MPPARPAGDGGTPSSPLRGLARSLLGFVETRARIAAGEFEEQILRFLEVAIWLLATVFFLGLALVFVSVLIVLAAWDSNRLLAAGLLAVLYVGAAVIGALMARKRLRERPPFLATTLAELGRDRERFSGGAGSGERPEA